LLESHFHILEKAHLLSNIKNRKKTEMAAKISPESGFTVASTTTNDSYKKDFHYMSMDEIKKTFKVNDFHKGLDSSRAKQLLLKNGKNSVKISYASFYMSVFKNLINGFSLLLWFSLLL
jgi:hypothetical protein